MQKFNIFQSGMCIARGSRVCHGAFLSQFIYFLNLTNKLNPPKSYLASLTVIASVSWVRDYMY